MLKKRKYFYKKKKPFFKKKFFWQIILFFVILGEIFYLLLFAPLFQINQIEIKGEKNEIEKEKIEKIVMENLEKKFLFFSSKSIFLANFQKVEDVLLKKFLILKNCHFKRKFPSKIILIPILRKPVAIFCQKKDCYFLDENGIIFKKIEKENFKDQKFLLIKSPKSSFLLGEQIILPKKLNQFLEIWKQFSALQIDLLYIPLLENGKLKVFTKEGWQAYFDLKENLKEQLQNLKIILEKEILPKKRKKLEYIDLRFGNKIYYKFKTTFSF